MKRSTLWQDVANLQHVTLPKDNELAKDVSEETVVGLTRLVEVGHSRIEL